MYDPANSDPFAADLQRRQQESRAARETAVPSGAAIFGLLSKLKAQITRLTDAIITITEIVTYIQTKRSAAFSAATWHATTVPPANTSTLIAWEPFNPTFDCAVMVRTRSGGLVVQVSAVINALNQAGVAVGYDVVWDGGGLPPLWPRSVTSIGLSPGHDVGVLSSGTAIGWPVCPPDTTVTVRTRRGVWGPSGTPSFIQAQSLAVEVEW